MKQTREQLIEKMVISKKEYQNKQKDLPFEKKLEILVRLQKKAAFFNKTRFKPWKLTK